jgi:preprotein translocase subunit SecY
MQNFLNKLKLVWTDKSLRNRLLFVLGALIVFRLFAAIPIPGIDALALNRFLSKHPTQTTICFLEICLSKLVLIYLENFAYYIVSLRTLTFSVLSSYLLHPI